MDRYEETCLPFFLSFSFSSFIGKVMFFSSLLFASSYDILEAAHDEDGNIRVEYM